MSLADGAGYDCATCPADVRVQRRCPKLAPGEDGLIQRDLQQIQGLDPDPTHEDACARLGQEALDPRLARWIGDHGPWSQGTLKVRGALDDQPLSWLDAMHVVDGALADHYREQRQAAEAQRSAGQRDGETAEAAGYPPLRPPYGKRG